MAVSSILIAIAFLGAHAAHAAATPDALLQYLNSRAGGQLTIDPSLQAAAQEKADQMNTDQWVIAVDADGRDYFYLPVDAGYTPYSSMGLNVLKTESDDPADWVNEWLQSGVYGSNMSRVLSGAYGDIGIGVTPGLVYYTFGPPQPGYYVSLYFADPVTPTVVNGNTKPALQTRAYWAIDAGTVFDPADMALCYDAEDGMLSRSSIVSDRQFDLSYAPLAHDTTYDVTITCTDSANLSTERVIEVKVKGGDGTHPLIIGTRNDGNLSVPSGENPWINVQAELYAVHGEAFDAADQAVCFAPVTSMPEGSYVQLPQSSLSADPIIPATAAVGSRHYVTIECTDSATSLSAQPRRVLVTVRDNVTGSGYQPTPAGTVITPPPTQTYNPTVYNYSGTANPGTNPGGVSTSTYQQAINYQPQPVEGDFAWQGKALVPCVGDDECRICHLLALAQNVINFLVFMAVAVAALLFVNAGILYVFASAKPGNVAKAHRIFTNTLIGLMIVVAAWLLSDVFLKAFYEGSQGESEWGPWNRILCGSDDPTIPSSLVGTTNSGGAGTAAGTNLNSANLNAYGDTYTTDHGTVYSDAHSREAFEALGLTRENGNIRESSPGATTFEGLREDTVEGFTEFTQEAYASGVLKQGDVQINSGTENAHTVSSGMSHGNGYKLDIEDTPQMQQYITDPNASGFTQTGYRTGAYGGPRYEKTLDSGQKMECVDEGSHFDCTFHPKS